MCIRDRGISKVPAEAAVIAAGDTLQALDIGRFNDRYFNYIAAFGAFTEVSYETPQQTKNIFGRAAYIIEGIKAVSYTHLDVYKRQGYDLNMLCDHKCRIEANAELTDDVDVVLLFVFVLERQRTGMRDRCV